MADTMTVPNETVSLSAEEEYNQDMVGKAADDGATIEQEAIETPEDKFGGDYDKLKASYEELEKKLHSTKVPDETQEGLGIPQDPPLAEGQIDMAALTEEWTANGGLSDKSYKNLESAGVTRDIADQFIEGRKAVGIQMGNTIRQSIGGDEIYSEMTKWAQANYSQDQLVAYNAAVQSGNMGTATMAAKALKSDYQNDTGMEGKTYGGKHIASEGGGDVFRSTAQVTAAMKDPKYEYDTAYRKDVLDKLDRSDVFSQGKL